MTSESWTSAIVKKGVVSLKQFKRFIISPQQSRQKPCFKKVCHEQNPQLLKILFKTRTQYLLGGIKQSR